MCTTSNRDQLLLDEQQKLNAELSELREWTENRMNMQLILHEQMVVIYDRMLTKCHVYEIELERNRTENARFKFTSRCLMDKIKELTSTGVKKFPIDSKNNDNECAKAEGKDHGNECAKAEDKDHGNKCAKAEDKDHGNECAKAEDKDHGNKCAKAEDKDHGNEYAKAENKDHGNECAKAEDKDHDNCNTDKVHENDSADNDIDPIAVYMEMCSITLIDEVGAYKEQVERATIELDNIDDQLTKAAETNSCLQRCVDNLTVMAENERMRRDKDELELRTTMDRLMTELAEVRQDIDRLHSEEAEILSKQMYREAAQAECDEVVRTENARMQAELGKNAIVEAALQSKLFDLELELEKRVEAPLMLQELCQSDFGGESIDSSSSSLILYQCNLSQTGDDCVASFPDFGRGDDQLIPCLMSSTKSFATPVDVRLPVLQSTNDDRQLSSSELTNGNLQLSYSTSTVVQDNIDTASSQSLDELKRLRLDNLIKKYESKHDDDF